MIDHRETWDTVRHRETTRREKVGPEWRYNHRITKCSHLLPPSNRREKNVKAEFDPYGCQTGSCFKKLMGNFTVQL